MAKSTTLQQIGGVAAGVASAVWAQPWIAGVYAAHITNLKGGSTFDIAKAGAIASGAAYAGGKLEGLKYTSDKIAAGIFIAGTAGVASGGDVGTSFAVAAFTVGSGAKLGQSGLHPVVGATIAATIGGTASQISGGKFANGAITGAFAYALAESMRQVRANNISAAGPKQTTVEIRYSRIRGIPFARHAFVVVTGPGGQQFGARGGPFGSGEGLFGSIQAEAGTFDARFSDYDAVVVASETALVTNQPYSEVVTALSEFAAAVNTARIPYNPLTTNSNAFAHQAVTVLGISRPTSPVFAPGSSTELQLP